MAQYRTPPWHVEYVPWGREIYRKIVSSDGAVVAIVPDGLDDDQATRNAVTMAKSPEMRELLMQIVRVFDHISEGDVDRRAATSDAIGEARKLLDELTDQGDGDVNT